MVSDVVWFHYDDARNLAYCFICEKAAQPKALKPLKVVDVRFMSRGYSNRKDCTGEKGSFVATRPVGVTRLQWKLLYLVTMVMD